MKTWKKTVGALVALGVVAAAGVLLLDRRTVPYNPPAIGAADLPKAIEHGRYVAVLGDCAACHNDREGHRAFAGGLPLATPFGEILASNITQDKATGIGDWTEAEFVRAVRDGKGKHGRDLYPAMPYNAYTQVSDTDMHDLWLYMKTVAPVDHAVDSNQLPFPFNVRELMAGWNLLFYRRGPVAPVAGKSEAWNRGRYLVDGLGHCASCHTPKNILGGDKGREYLAGGSLEGWFAADITSNPHTGIGSWSNDDIVRYLKIGGNRFTVAAGPMAEAVENSTQYMSDDDLGAIATYLKDSAPSAAQPPVAIASTDARMVRGKQLYSDNCEACHVPSGQGVPDMIPAIVGNPAMQQTNPAVMLRSILVGNRGASTDGNPTGASMPSFDWKLTDEQVADIATYVRNADGNRASAIPVDEVTRARAALKAKQPVQPPR